MMRWLVVIGLSIWTGANVGLSYFLLARIHAWGIKHAQLDDETMIYRQQLKLEVDALVQQVVADPTNPKWRNVPPRLP